jgi:hypothetical protein
MSERIAPSTGEVIAGVFLLLFGAVLLLAGGACTALWITGLASSGGREMAGMLPGLAISVVTAGFGLLCLKGAVSCFRSKAPPEPPAP